MLAETDSRAVVGVSLGRETQDAKEYCVRGKRKKEVSRLEIRREGHQGGG